MGVFAEPAKAISAETPDTSEKRGASENKRAPELSRELTLSSAAVTLQAITLLAILLEEWLVNFR